ncbi:MAG: hypothetical protein JWR27_1173 [Aeromicrobium sp.]|nr:hypothetical protein [Aeromicrobium sp.]
MRIFKHPIKKLTLLSAFAGGYVLGAKAGRERYEQIVDTANQVKTDPRVQQATARAEDLVREAATKVTEDPRVKDVVQRAEEIVRDATSSVPDASVDDPNDASAAPPPAPTPTAPAGSFETDDEIVFSTGPDIEESIDELAPKSDDERL